MLLGGTHHYMGTTRMGTRRRNSVVDADCRVHETTNLYVAGSSVFPGGGWENPTLALVALAARLGRHLPRDHHDKRGRTLPRRVTTQ